MVARPLSIWLLPLRYVHGDAAEVFIGAAGLHAGEALDLTPALAAKNLEQGGACLISKHETHPSAVKARVTEEARIDHSIQELEEEFMGVLLSLLSRGVVAPYRVNTVKDEFRVWKGYLADSSHIVSEDA